MNDKEKVGLAINGTLRKLADVKETEERPAAVQLWVEYEVEDERNPGEPEPKLERFYLARDKVPLTLKRGDNVAIAVKLIPASERGPARLMAIRAIGERKSDSVGTSKVT